MPDELSLENILPKAAADLSEEERQYLNDNKSQLTEEQKEKFASVLSDEAPNTAQDGDSDKDDKEETNE